jgi:hypothetical protein
VVLFPSGHRLNSEYCSNSITYQNALRIYVHCMRMRMSLVTIVAAAKVPTCHFQNLNRKLCCWSHLSRYSAGDGVYWSDSRSGHIKPGQSYPFFPFVGTLMFIWGSRDNVKSVGTSSSPHGNRTSVIHDVYFDGVWEHMPLRLLVQFFITAHIIKSKIY